MAVAQGIIRVFQKDQTVTFLVEGLAVMAQGLAVRRFAEQALADGATNLRVDLRHCTYMDSTFLGTLLFLMRAVDQVGKDGFTLVSPSPACFQVLQQMELDHIYAIVTEEEPSARDWTELKCETQDVNFFKRTVVQAHQELANLSGPAGDTFRKVARCLTEDQKAKEAR